MTRLAGNGPTQEQVAMNRTRRTRRSFARDGFSRQFIQDVASAASIAVGHQLGQPGHQSRAAGCARRPATTATASRCTLAAPGLLAHTIQLCIHCRQNPAGFWVSRTGGWTVRRPWCLSCCQGLDRDRCDVIPFDS
jgi:hypothetical protein